MKFHDNLMFPAAEAADRDAVLRLLGGAVTKAGLARADYVQGLIEREGSFPTGLPVPGGVAIPHTSAEYVSADTIAVATLAAPVAFGEMGGDDGSDVAVSFVFLLVLANAAEHAGRLGNVIRTVQDEKFLATLRAATTPEALAAAMRAAFPE